MNNTIRNTVSILALVTLLVVSFYLISDATSNSATFGKYYNWLRFFNVIGLISLLALIIYNVYKLIVQYRLKTIGSRLTARMMGVFVPEHPVVATSLETYATLLRETARPDEAERMEARAKAIRAMSE